ncbi:hypothetical protein N656DRAFT_296962 [Canariomyces notabilis]|uniref:Uncharacterized protein n=1 Tax=Canariomyces notabilis TaxID=2074819 RepID=A0AAN6T9F1_9PEZI|nr:hypothetical protein N656DRAFT_296962 [Canariomyces arenarius]
MLGWVWEPWEMGWGNLNCGGGHTSQLTQVRTMPQMVLSTGGGRSSAVRMRRLRCCHTLWSFSDGCEADKSCYDASRSGCCRCKPRGICEWYGQVEPRDVTSLAVLQPFLHRRRAIHASKAPRWTDPIGGPRSFALAVQSNRPDTTRRSVAFAKAHRIWRMVGVAEYKMEKEEKAREGRREGPSQWSQANRARGVEGLANPANPIPEIRQWLTAVVDGPPSKLASPWPPAVCQLAQFTVNPTALAALCRAVPITR